MYNSNDSDSRPSPLAVRHDRRKKVFAWVALIGISVSVLGGVLSQILN
jgi:hypothetical protein